MTQRCLIFIPDTMYNDIDLPLISNITKKNKQTNNKNKQTDKQKTNKQTKKHHGL